MVRSARAASSMASVERRKTALPFGLLAQIPTLLTVYRANHG